MSFLREWRHSPCLMTPLTAIMIILMLVLGFIGLFFQIPGMVIGILIGVMSRRGNWFVEFLYPLGLARWGHLALLRWGSKGKNGVKLGEDGRILHSRSIEQRTEVLKGRIYIHPLPQLLDNIGYLIVCLPPRSILKNSRLKEDVPPILGILIDCGDADEVSEQLEYIQDVHYGHLPCEIQIKTLLSTHKHHDHTAGNAGLLRHPKIGKTLKHIYGGAIERVPLCNSFVFDGSFITMPSAGNNNMNTVVSIECIAAPSHTRGSIVYCLRNKSRSEMYDDASLQTPEGGSNVFAYLFTGDAMFSGGGGVPFESDIEFPKDLDLDSKKSTDQFKPGGGSLSIERCFADILRRGIDDRDVIKSPHCGSQQMLIFPGHEYTFDLLQRQLQSESMQPNNSMWNRHTPSVFFEIASQFFIAGHRRHLPKSTRVLTVPTSMQRELKINPYYRSLKKRGEHILTAIHVWYKHGKRCKRIKVANTSEMAYLTMPKSQSVDESVAQNTFSLKSPSSETTWNMNHEDLNRSVFTTIYSSDLKTVIDQLKNGKIQPEQAAYKLSKLEEKLEEQTVMRRPVPNTFPSEKKMYLGLIAISVLGSKPAAMTYDDSTKMNLAAPVDNTDYLLISKSRLIAALFRLGLLSSNSNDLESNDIVQMIHLLWEAAWSDFEGLTLDDERQDLEVQNEQKDLIELGALKLVLFAVPYNQPSWFKKYCMPCASDPRVALSAKKAETMQVRKRSGGELVRHDISKCPMCANVLGCPLHNGHDDDDDDSYEEELFARGSSMGVQVVKGSPRSPGRSGDEVELREVNVHRREKEVKVKV